MTLICFTNDRVVLIDYMISWTVFEKLPTVIQPLINSPRQGRRREFMFPSVSECRQSLSDFDVWFFSTWLRDHRLDCTRYWLSSNIVWEGFDKCEVIPDRHGPTKLKRVFCKDYEIFSLNVCFITRWPALSYQNGDSLYCCSLAGAWTGIDLCVYCLLNSMQFCGNSNVSDLICQCASSHVDFQVLQFYVINCYNPQSVLFSIKYFPRFRWTNSWPWHWSTCCTFLVNERG